MSAPLPPLLRLRGASVQLGSVQALRDATLDVHRGDFIALVGANGSGKTTLLRLLHGQVAHTGVREGLARGTVQAMVYQRPFMLRLSVANNLHVALWLAGVPRRERALRAAQALQRVGLAALSHRPARVLSGGEQQRLHWRGRGRCGRTCCSSTSPPPASTPAPSARSRRFSKASEAKA